MDRRSWGATMLVGALVLLFPIGGATRADAATCVGSIGPGIAPPAAVRGGVPGFHAAWYGQSGYPSLCAGGRATATVAFYNSGSRGWVAGRMGESAYLGTSGPEPGQDRPSALGGDGTNGSPATGWTRYDRPAVQPAGYVGPGQVAWFQFNVQAPAAPGVYRLALRPLVEGAAWLEDYGVFWYVTVLNPDGSLPPLPPTPVATTVTASYFGPGLYGNRTACGLTLTATLHGVAHRTLACGSPVRLSYAGRTVTVPVIDRGPFIAQREFDLSYATKQALSCPDICTLSWLR